MEDVAIKVTNMSELQQICTELVMQKGVPHPNIVAIDCCYSWEDNLYVSDEFVASVVHFYCMLVLLVLYSFCHKD